MRRARGIRRRPLSTLGRVFWIWILEAASVSETLQVETWFDRGKNGRASS